MKIEIYDGPHKSVFVDVINPPPDTIRMPLRKNYPFDDLKIILYKLDYYANENGQITKYYRI